MQISTSPYRDSLLSSSNTGWTPPVLARSKKPTLDWKLVNFARTTSRFRNRNQNAPFITLVFRLNWSTPKLLTNDWYATIITMDQGRSWSVNAVKYHFPLLQVVATFGIVWKPRPFWQTRNYFRIFLLDVWVLNLNVDIAKHFRKVSQRFFFSLPKKWWINYSWHSTRLNTDLHSRRSAYKQQRLQDVVKQRVWPKTLEFGPKDINVVFFSKTGISRWRNRSKSREKGFRVYGADQTLTPQKRTK